MKRILKGFMNTEELDNHNLCMTIMVLIAYVLITTVFLIGNFVTLINDLNSTNANVETYKNLILDEIDKLDQRISKNETVYVDLSEVLESNTQAIELNQAQITQNKIDADGYSKQSFNFIVNELYDFYDGLVERVIKIERWVY